MRENCCWNSNKRWHYTFHPLPRMRLNEVLNSQQHGCETECVEKWVFLLLQIKYSIMHPGTHVWPHTGPTNCRLRMHLGLVIPKEGCRIRCAQENRYACNFTCQTLKSWLQLLLKCVKISCLQQELYIQKQGWDFPCEQSKCVCCWQWTGFFVSFPFGRGGVWATVKGNGARRKTYFEQFPLLSSWWFRAVVSWWFPIEKRPGWRRKVSIMPFLASCATAVCTRDRTETMRISCLVTSVPPSTAV